MRLWCALLALALVLASGTVFAQIFGPPRPLPPYPYPIYQQPVVPDQSMEFFGAIAYQRATGAVGFSFDWPTQRGAEVEALNRCVDPQCVVVTSFKSGCGALAVGPNGAFPAQGATRNEAEAKALQACSDVVNCAVQIWACTQ